MPRPMNRPIEGFAERLKDKWLESGIKQADLGLMCGKERKSINAYINGMTVPDATTLAKMCYALHTTPNWQILGKE